MPKTLNELIDAQLGVRVRPQINPLTSSVGTTPTRIFSNNPNRVAFLVVNISANKVFLLPDNTVTTSRGILLTNNGGGLVANWREDFHLVGYEWWAVADAAGSSILCLELITY